MKETKIFFDTNSLNKGYNNNNTPNPYNQEIGGKMEDISWLLR